MALAVLKKRILLILLAALLLPGLSFADPGEATYWTSTNVTTYLHKNIVSSSTTVLLTRTCTPGEKIGEATCPPPGSFNYAIPKSKNPTSTFPYYIYKRSIARTTKLPDNLWKMRAETLAGSHGTDIVNSSYSISKIMDNTVVTFNKNKNGSNTTPEDASPKDNPYNDPVLTPGAGTTDEGTDTKGGPLAVGFNGDGIPTIDLDDSRCPEGSTTYTSGILNGVPCEGAIKTLKGALILVKNVVQVFLLPLVGTVFLIMLILGGILYITSRGNQQQAERAKKTLTAAIIGLVIITLSYTLIAIFASVLGGGIS